MKSINEFPNLNTSDAQRISGDIQPAQFWDGTWWLAR